MARGTASGATTPVRVPIGDLSLNRGGDVLRHFEMAFASARRRVIEGMRQVGELALRRQVRPQVAKRLRRLMEVSRVERA